MKKDEKEFYEEARESVQESRTGSRFAALRKRLAGTGEEAGLQVRSALLLVALLVALGFWVLDDETEPEPEMSASFLTSGNSFGITRSSAHFSKRMNCTTLLRLPS